MKSLLACSSTGTVCRSFARGIHSSLPRLLLVGRPDPISNLRPVVYDDPLPSSRDSRTHPYSLTEVTNVDPLEYQLRMERQQLDAFNQAFWTDVRTSLVYVVYHNFTTTYKWNRIISDSTLVGTTFFVCYQKMLLQKRKRSCFHLSTRGGRGRNAKGN